LRGMLLTEIALAALELVTPHLEHHDLARSWSRGLCDL
jgi:hypothetical protein